MIFVMIETLNPVFSKREQSAHVKAVMYDIL
jgi:hypothetical protein